MQSDSACLLARLWNLFHSFVLHKKRMKPSISPIASPMLIVMKPKKEEPGPRGRTHSWEAWEAKKERKRQKEVRGIEPGLAHESEPESSLEEAGPP